MTLLRVDDLSVWFRTDTDVLRAVTEVSLQVRRGQTLGVVGESGSGKSVLTRAIMGIQPHEGLARLSGRVSFDGIELLTLSRAQLRAVWGARIGIVPQNPEASLNPVVRVGRQITEVLRYRFGLDRTEARVRALELLDQVGIPAPERRLREFPHQLSGGMQQRVVIAMALAGDPDLLIADEPTTALDVTVQAQILALLRQIQSDRGMAMIFVTHDLGVVSGLADEIGVMYAGRMVEVGPADAVLARPTMPYTAALLRSSPSLDHDPARRLDVIPGRPPSATVDVAGCPFAPRCDRSIDRCAGERPPLAPTAGECRHVACWNPVVHDGR